jgi:hypothetical protein
MNRLTFLSLFPLIIRFRGNRRELCPRKPAFGNEANSSRPFLAIRDTITAAINGSLCRGVEKEQIMGVITAGQVKNGVIVPNMPLPEGAWCRIEVQGVPLEVDPELQAELDAWQLASSHALELVERLAAEMDDNEKK